MSKILQSLLRLDGKLFNNFFYQFYKSRSNASRLNSTFSHKLFIYYSMIFMHCRDKINNVFECGLGTNNTNLKSSIGNTGKPGVSLYMWRDFFPNAKIYGGDIDKNILFSSERIKTYHLDQTSKSSIKKYFTLVGCKDFDVMVDDGLHTFDAAKCLYLNSRQYLAKTGLYIIEDLSQNELPKCISFIQSLKLHAKIVNLHRPGLPLMDNSLLLISSRS